MRMSLPSVLIFLSLIAGCKSAETDTPVYKAPQKNPTKVSAVQIPNTNSAVLTWKDNSETETGYRIWLHDYEGDSVIADLPANDTTYTVTSGLRAGEKIQLGVQALDEDEKLASLIVYAELELFDYSQLPTVVLNDEWTSTPTSVALTYTIAAGSTKYPKVSYGLCWSADHTPTIEDGHQHGPNVSSGKYIQAITSASMDYGKTYRVRGYVETSMGYKYSEQELSVTLGTPAEPIVLNWTEITPSDFPEEIKVYKTADQLHGRPFNAWYAIADVSTGNVEFKFEFGKSATLEKWYSEGNYVMTNAGYFNMTTLEVGDFCADKGEITPCKYASIPRGAFAVDRNQVPKAFWTAKSTEGVTYYYNEPEPLIKEVNSYNTVKEHYPSESFEFYPYYAMCAGPLLVKDGKIVADVTMENSTFVRNYEDIALDIFTNTSITPDRTAVGYTEDGKIILFICDGRIQASRGASIEEMGQLMLGLGCYGAVNFDGGGSTAMTLWGVRQNSLETNMTGSTGNRSVGSVMGFYKK